jgi:hypothetical protein
MGVTFDKQRNKYRASFQEDGKTKHIGRFDTERKAKLALNKVLRAKSEQVNVQRTSLKGKLDGVQAPAVEPRKFDQHELINASDDQVQYETGNESIQNHFVPNLKDRAIRLKNKLTRTAARWTR